VKIESKPMAPVAPGYDAREKGQGLHGTRRVGLGKCVPTCGGARERPHAYPALGKQKRPLPPTPRRTHRWSKRTPTLRLLSVQIPRPSSATRPVFCFSAGNTQESNFTELEKAFAEARRRSLAQGVKAPAKKKPAEAAAEKPAAATGAAKAVASKAAKPKTAATPKVED